MRIISLEFEGIGSFADRMEIDFQRLGAAGLFLVEGPTGSGKSTILDAVVFALYGSVAGATSDIGRLDSHVRNPAHEPYVELVFECDGRRYRIRRSPRHQRDKKRGSGRTDDNGSVTLLQVLPEPAEISHRAREVGDWIIEHIGLTRSQFASTIVLAQGEFATFLDADTSTRADILEKVFGTEFYKDLEVQLAGMRKVALQQRRDVQARVQETGDRCLGALGLAPCDDPLGSIEGEISGLREQLGQAREEAEVAGAELASAEVALKQALGLADAQQRKRHLIDRQQTLVAAAEGVDRMRAALVAHDRAHPVEPAAQAWEAAAAEVAAACAEQERAGALLTALGLEVASDESLAAVERTIGELAAAAAAEQRLPAVRQAVPTLQDEVSRAQQTCSAVAAQRSELDTEMQRWRQQLPDGDDAQEVLAGLTVEAAAVATSLRTWDEVDALQADLVAARAELDLALTAHDQARAELERGRLRHAESQAASLAASLAQGEPCLVCGAVEHPHPAQASTVALPDLDELEASEVQTGERLRGRSAQVERLQAGVEARQTGLQADRAGLQQRAEELAVELTRCRAKAEVTRTARNTLDGLVKQAAELAEAGATAELSLQQARNDLQAAAQQCDALEQQVAQARASHPSVAQRVDLLHEQAQVLRAVLSALTSHARAQASHEQAAGTLAAMLEQVGLPDVVTARAAILPAERERQWRAAVHDHERALVEISAGLSQLRDVDLEEVVDLAALRESLAERQLRCTALSEQVGSIGYRLEQAVPLRDELVACLCERDRVEQDTAGVIRMADLATANRSEVVHRVRLSSFVLMRRFQAVVDAANDRLDAISEGRYQLLVEHGGLDNRGLAGLDLLVADQRTEQSRSTRSLSGGERFYVALALALGLADVVRSESGGVELGTLFIDEGFGSLDTQTLDEVMDMLEQVRAGQDRVIGLVSHVEILKQRINPRISVRREPHRPGVSRLEVCV